MQFKRPHMQAQFEELPDILKDICYEFDSLSQSFGIDSVITRISDPIEGESGIHRLKRAVDFRDEYQGKFTYTNEQKYQLIELIQNLYKRSDSKPVIYYHSFNGAPMHFHIQVPYFLERIRKVTHEE